MVSRQSFMNMVFIVGMSMIVIGLAIIGGGLFLRRRRIIRSKFSNSISKVYSPIDVNTHQQMGRLALNDYDAIDISLPTNTRILNAKNAIVEGKQQLRNLAKDQTKFSNMIVDNDIKNTFVIKDGVVVFDAALTQKYPKLVKHLNKLHRVQNKIRHNWDELDILVKDVNSKVTINNMFKINMLTRDLITNNMKMKANWANRNEIGKLHPEFERDFWNLMGRNQKTLSSEAQINKFLKLEKQQLLRENIQITNKLNELKQSNELLEQNRVKI